MASERLGEKIGISEELVKTSCRLSLQAQDYPNELFHVAKHSSETVLIVFTGSWLVIDWFSGDKAFGETEINRELFPSMRSIGNDEVATVNQAFLKRFELVWKNPKFQEEVETAIRQGKLIIFTGHSAGGSIAVLATIWFLEKYSKARTAKCVTFGSPLVGDFIVSHSLKREKWSQHFVHFVMRYDIVPRILFAPLSSIQQEFEHILHYFTAKNHQFPGESITADFYAKVMSNTSSLASHAACKLMGSTNLLLETLTNFIQLSPYKPFGTYVFCTGNGKLVHLDNPEAVLQLLFYSCQLSNEAEKEATARSCISAHLGYGTELSGDDCSLDMQDVVYVDQLAQLPLASDGDALNDLGLSTREIKEGMKGLEEYRRFNEQKGGGYYDAFKKQDDKRDFDANVKRLVLAGIWDEIIEMLKRYDLPDEFEGQEYWIDLGTEFRRLVEPLDIANYYRHAKNEDTGAYMVKGRPRRYRYTQRWLEKKDGVESGTHGESWFWAEVEELLKQASNGGNVEKAKADKLQKELIQWIDNKLVGKDVLLGESTFVKLWDKLVHLKLQNNTIQQWMTQLSISS
ncbi:hypothetical protein M0R45_023127 [Rubus argutus]|uniref:Uncharacterized protein n=1 Tax=Rubus argutus TaxID=59490 RepID=A0AAW1WLS0_RUBAR